MMTETQIGERDRWLIDGDCSQCRRASYCSKVCTMRRRNAQRILIQGMRRMTGADVIESKLKEACGE